MENSKHKRFLKSKEGVKRAALGVSNVRLPLALLSTKTLEEMLEKLEKDEIKVRKDIKTIKYILSSRKGD